MKIKIYKILLVAILPIVLLSTCKKEEHVNGIILDPLEFVIGIGETATFTVTFVPKNATNKKVSWESSDTNVATVVNGKVTGIASGRTKITVSSQSSGQTAIAWVYVVQPNEFEMIFVEGDTFLMGCGDGDCYLDSWTNELPQHYVTLSSFYIAKYEVTQMQWLSIMGSNPSYFKGDDLPVENVNWFDVQNFIENLNRLTGKSYRLPTEAEWEYAARGGNKSKGYKYSGSNNIIEVAWCMVGATHYVGTKSPNELGIYDMSGNVLEWCNDWIGGYTDEPQTDPQGPETPQYSYRMVRGGNWASTVWDCRVSSRPCENPFRRAAFYGFRLVHPVD